MDIVLNIVGKCVEPIVGYTVEPIVDYTVKPIARQVGYVSFYKHNFKNLKDQVAELKRVKDTISHEVEAERRDGRHIYDAVQNWLDRVDGIIEAAEKLGDDPGHSNADCCRGPFPDLKSRHQLSRKAKKMADNISEVMQGKDNFGQLAFLPHLEGVGTTSATSSDKLESRRKMKEDIVLALSDPNVSRIGVYGLGGMGKTTLVKEIAKQVKDDKQFDEVVIANISQDADVERIQGEIADFLGLSFKDKETTVAGKAVRLRQRIKNEKSILVILDDIWAILDLDKLGIPPNDHKGCKLLLTSRNLHLLQDMETQKNFKIDVLNDAEAWSLFEDMVGDIKDDCLREVAKQVAQKCAGMIVLIVTVARALKDKDEIDSWRNALNQLKSVDKKGMNEKIYSTLEFSYNHLEGDDVKALFLLCGLLGSQNDVDNLLKYAVGLGVFKQTYTLKDARPELHKLIGSLKASCLLLESNTKEKVKMHDIVREVAVSIASKDQHVFKIGTGVELKKWPPEEFLLQRCTQIILDCVIPKLPERLDCPNIKLFCLYNKNESLSVPDSFFEGMKNLKVLDLTRMHLPSLPQSFHSLIDLRTLCLDFCTLGDMNNIGALTNLQILSLIGSSMITLPSELGQLTHLIMLDLTNSGIEIFPSDIISKLTTLEELYVGNTCIKWEQKDLNDENKNASLSELRHLTNLNALEIQIKEASVLPRHIIFDKLERHKIVIGDFWEWSDSYGASKILKLKLGNAMHLGHGIRELIKGVEDLYLDEVDEISNVLYDLNGEGFLLLKHLHIQNNGTIKHIINSMMERKRSHVFFPKLETLTLQNLNILEKLCLGSFVNNSFAKLRSVKVQCCDQLKYLFSVLMVKALCQLVEIDVSECNSMKKIVSVENTFPNSEIVDDNIEFCSLKSLTLRYMPAMEDFYSGLLTSSTTTMQSLSLSTNVTSSFFNTKVKFSTLETLKLSSIQLEHIWQEDHLCLANSFHKLANLTIEECNGLKYLFSSSMIGNFPNLKKVEVRECEMMEQIIDPEGRNDTSIEEIWLPRLERFVISNMRRLKKVWHSQFQWLKTMEVNSCEKLENIFPNDIHTSFGRMETLKVSDCGSVKEIFQLPANEINIEEETELKKLHLLRLPKLKQLWSKDPQGTFRFHNLQNVLVEECVNLEYLFPFSIAKDLPQLEKLTVGTCGMKEIVSKKEGPMEEKAIFHFDRLYSLRIWNMLQLDRFYSGSHSLTCPSLRKLWNFNCAKLKLLGRQSTSNHRKNADDHNPNISTQKPLFIIEDVIPKLERWALENEEATMVLQDPQWKDMYLSKLKFLRLSNFAEDEAAATFLDTIVQKASNFKSLLVQHSSMKEIFRDERIAYKEGNNKINTQLEFLSLHNLQLQHICREGCKIDPMLEVLEDLYVTECVNLTFFVPSSATFSHLTCLKITKCNGLINLIYSSTATSLVNLQDIQLKECKSLEEIVTQVMNEEKDEIVFRSMRTLTLECLPRLNIFSSSHCFFRFPLLKKVVVRQCAKMKTFCEGATSTPMLRKVILKEGKDEEWCWEADLNRTIKKIYADKISFRTMEHLELSLYHELRDSWSSLVENGIFCNLKSLVVEHCDFLSHVLIPSNLLRALWNLEEIQVRDCDSLEAVLEFDTAREEAISEKEASHLQKICLFNLPKLQYIWKPSLGGKGTDDAVQLQHQQPLSFTAKVLLPKLETIIIEDMENLETIWHPDLTLNSMGSFKTLKVKSCQKIQHIFPIYMLGAFATIEMLMVEDCNFVLEIFRIGDIVTRCEDDTTRLTNITLLRLPKVKQIWSRDPPSSLFFKNLQVVRVEDCDDLEYLFPFSMAKNLPQLETITIKNAEKMKQIVSKREEPLDNPVQFVFNQLTSMVLWNLHNLQEFCAGNHSLSCSMMNKLDVFNCKELKLFKTQGTGRLSDGSNLRLSMQQPLFTLEEVMDNLETLALSSEHLSIILQGHFSGKHFRKLKLLTLLEFEDDQTNFPYWFLQNMPGLEHLIVALSSFKEIFPVKVPIHLEGKNENNTRIKKLKLRKLHELRHICKEGCQTDPLVEVLEYLNVDGCSELKRLVPSSVNFNHLTYLEVQNCKGLIYLITSSTARSLDKLTTLKIRKCDSIEEIVAGKGEDSINEITFNSLQVLVLDSLSKLQMFCSGDCLLKLPLLVELVIRQCPRMTGFSTGETSSPMLQKIVTDDEDGKWCWDGDLTKTINKMFHDMIAFRGMEHLDLSVYYELRGTWSILVENRIFCNLKSLFVEHCDFLSHVLIPSNLLRALGNLEEVQVRDCDSLEVVLEFDTAREEASHLRNIRLFNLPTLQYIWKPSLGGKGEEDAVQIQHQQPLSFTAKVLLPKLETIILEDMKNLETIWHPIITSNSMGSFETLKVEKCHKIEQIFPKYMHGAYRTLETLEVKDCDSMQEIFQLGVNDICSGNHTTQLKNLTLLGLQKLKQIWSKDPQSSIRFKSLQVVRIEDCDDLEYLFPFSIAKNLPQLETITIKDAEKMKEIVSKREEPLDNPVQFVFNQLTSMVLWNLKELQGFCVGNHSLSCSMMSELDVFNCKKLKVFQTQGTRITSSQGRLSDDGSNLQPWMQQPLFKLEEVMDNLETLTLLSEHLSIISQGHFSGKHFRKLKLLLLEGILDDQSTFLYWFLQNMPCLEHLIVALSSFKEIFPDEIPIHPKEKIENTTRIKKLTLHGLQELHHICKEGRQIHPILEGLECIKVNACSKLKHLVPSSVTFNHLTYLEVRNCKGLIYLITSSIARSLDKLTTLKIRKCDSIEEILEGKGGDSINEITLNSLLVLELDSLSKLQMFCSGDCLLKLPLLVKLVVRQCPRMIGFSTGETSAPMLQKIVTDEEDGKWCWDGDLTGTITKMFHDMAIGEEVEGDYKESSSSINIQNSQMHQTIASTSRALTSEEHGEKSKAGEIVDPRKQEMHKLPIPHEGTDTQKISEISETPLDEANQNILSRTKIDAAPGNEEMNEGVESALTNTTVQETECKNQEMYKALSPVAQDVFISVESSLVQSTKIAPSTVYDAGTGTHVTHESIDKPFVQAAQNAWDISKVQKKAVGTGKMYQSKRRFSVHDDQNILSHITAYGSDSAIDETISFIDLAPSQGSKATSSSTTPVAGGFLAIGTQEIHETMDKPLIKTNQDAEKIVVAKNRGESRDSYVETQKICDIIEKPSILSTQNVPNSTMIQAIDPSPSQAPKPMISSNNYGNYKGMIDIHEHNMPYLKAGLNRHPQVLNWLNTKRQRVFASSFFSLFAEVTRILRTTRKVDLTEDDRNYIRECCAALQGVGFDESWISYVHGCIEECRDEKDLKRKIEEAEDDASNMKAQLESIMKELASVEESLVLLRDKANRLHDFIES